MIELTCVTRVKGFEHSAIVPFKQGKGRRTMVCIRWLQCAAVILGGVFLPATMQATAASTVPVIGAPPTGSVLDARLKRPIRVRLIRSLDAHRSTSGHGS